MRIDYDLLDDEYNFDQPDNPTILRMHRIRDDEPRREKRNKPKRRDKWEGVGNDEDVS